jgi:hypothetical protein
VRGARWADARPLERLSLVIEAERSHEFDKRGKSSHSECGLRWESGVESGKVEGVERAGRMPSRPASNKKVSGTRIKPGRVNRGAGADRGQEESTGIFTRAPWKRRAEARTGPGSPSADGYSGRITSIPKGMCSIRPAPGSPGGAADGDDNDDDGRRWTSASRILCSIHPGGTDGRLHDRCPYRRADRACRMLGSFPRQHSKTTVCHSAEMISQQDHGSRRTVQRFRSRLTRTCIMNCLLEDVMAGLGGTPK